jgi:hypothetical protein
MPTAVCRCRTSCASRREQGHVLQVAREVRRRVGVGREADVKRLRELEAEKGKLKRIYADLALENAAITDVLNRKL